MSFLSDKRGFVDPEVLYSPGFLILAALAITATVMGYVFSVRSELIAMPIWQLAIVIIAEVIAAYFFAAQG